MNEKQVMNFIKDNNITLVHKHIDNVKGCFIRYKDLNIIVLEPTLKRAERLKVLQHEIGHFLSNATYSINETDTRKIMDAERKAEQIARELRGNWPPFYYISDTKN